MISIIHSFKIIFRKQIFLLFIALLLQLLVSENSSAQPTHNISLFALQDVRLLPGMFNEAAKTDMQYMLAMDVDRLLAPYLREAGLPAKAESYTNWENTGLDGHIVGHYLSALSLMYASTGNPQMLSRLNFMIDELQRCQVANGDGYVGGVPGSKALWKSVMQGDLKALEQKWVPLYNIHKVFAGLRDAYLYAGNATAKNMLVKFSDWFVQLANTLSVEQMQQMLRIEHGGINEVLADVYVITGNKKYLAAAYKFSHQAILQPLQKDEDRLDNLHANTQIPKVIGFKRIADANADSAYNHAAHFFWNTVVNNRTVAIGGNSVSEHFNPKNNFSSMVTSVEGPETCNTYNMLKLTKMLYQSDASVNYIDFYERALYNQVLPTQLTGRGGFVYFTPMRAGHYRVYSQPETSMWCCVGSGIENQAKYNELIYAHDYNNLFINLFIPSQLTWKEKGLLLTQQTHFPEDDKTTLTIVAAPSSALSINIRYPKWVTSGKMKVKVNGKEISTDAEPSSYVSIKRLWKKGDKIEVMLPMHTSTERLPDGSNYLAVIHGPIVLAAKTDTSGMNGLFADDSRMGHIASGPQLSLDKTPMFVTTSANIAAEIQPVPGKPLTFSAPNLLYPDSYKSLQLIPFYKVNASRYVIYWQTETPAGLDSIRQQMAQQEAEAAKLQSITIDLVKPGEQQPESDHFMKSENSNAGINKDRHWRDATGWFSYQLIDRQHQAIALRITYFGRDNGRQFQILVNDSVIATQVLDGTKGDDFFTIDYPLPAQLVQQSGGMLTVKFLADQGFVAGGVYEVRLMKKEE